MKIKKDILLSKREFLGITQSSLFCDLIRNKYLILFEEDDSQEEYLNWLSSNISSQYYFEETIEEGKQILVLYLSSKDDVNLIENYKDCK